MEIATCRYCKSDIIWTETTNGKKMPVDPEPTEDGTFSLDDNEDPPIAKFLPPRERKGDLYQSHIETCTA